MSSSSARKVRCAYCGVRAVPTDEHVLPRWARRELKGYHAWIPGRTKHQWGGDSVVYDVCGPCNHGPLSRLDKAARVWWLATLANSNAIAPAEALTLAKWAAKVLYNSQRAAVAEGRLGREPRMPKGVGRWIIGQNATHARLSVCAAMIPAAARDAELPAGIYSYGEADWPCRSLVLPAAVLYVSWDGPPKPGFTATQSARWLCDNAPAIRLDGVHSGRTRAVPDLRDPRVLHRGLYRRMGK